MNRYNVLVEVTIDGTVYPVSSVVELTEEVAASYVEAGNLELVVDEATASEPVETVASEPTASEEVAA
jgi:hypothetical protein